MNKKVDKIFDEIYDLIDKSNKIDFAEKTEPVEPHFDSTQQFNTNKQKIFDAVSYYNSKLKYNSSLAEASFDKINCEFKFKCRGCGKYFSIEEENLQEWKGYMSQSYFCHNSEKCQPWMHGL